MNTQSYHVIKGNRGSNNKFSIERNELAIPIFNKPNNTPAFSRYSKRTSFVDAVQGPHPNRFEPFESITQVHSKHKREISYQFDRLAARDLSKTLLPKK